MGSSSAVRAVKPCEELGEAGGASDGGGPPGGEQEERLGAGREQQQAEGQKVGTSSRGPRAVGSGNSFIVRTQTVRPPTATDGVTQTL